MAIETQDQRRYWQGAGLALLWFAVLAGPVAMAVNQFMGYVLVKWVCASGHKNLLTAISLATLLLATTGAWVGWTCRERVRDAKEHGGRIVDRSYFVAIVAVGLAAITALLIVLQAFPRFVLSPCE
jgi:uncharacterized membrane protein (DUF4010 family)